MQSLWFVSVEWALGDSGERVTFGEGGDKGVKGEMGVVSDLVSPLQLPVMLTDCSSLIQLSRKSRLIYPSKIALLIITLLLTAAGNASCSSVASLGDKTYELVSPSF